jgi:hypothetical protein
MNIQRSSPMLRATALLFAALAATAAAASPGKPGAPVDIGYAVIGTPRAGQPVEVEITYTLRGKVDEVRLDYGTSASLALDRGVPETQALIAQKGGVPAVQRVRVVPQGDGLHYLKVRVVTVADGHSRMRGVAIPIGVGKFDARKQLKQNGTLIEGVGGERAVVMRSAGG